MIFKLIKRLFVLPFLLFGCSRANAASGEDMTATRENLVEVYSDLRDQALNLNFETGAQSDGIELVLMEIGYPEAVATLVMVQDGSASLYFSSGGGIIGAGGQEGVNAAVKSFMSQVPDFIENADKVDSYPLPQPGWVRFYFVSKDTVKTLNAKEEVLGNGRDALSALFYKAQDVITAIREAELLSGS